MGHELKTLKRSSLKTFQTTWTEPKESLSGGKRRHLRPAVPIADVSHVGTVLDCCTRVVDKYGKTLLIYQCLDDPAHNMAAEHVRKTLPDVLYAQDYRSQGLKSTSAVFGYMPRNPIRRNFCHVSRMAYETPEAHQALVDFASCADDVFKRDAPTIRASQHAMISKAVGADWRMGDTPWTSGIVNRSSPLHYHCDKGNFKGRWSAMLVLRKNCKGGELVIPQLDLAVPCEDKSLLLFNGADYWHGVAPMRRGRNGYRFSCVFYSLQQLVHCLSTKEEIERAKAFRTKVESKPRPKRKRK